MLKEKKNLKVLVILAVLVISVCMLSGCGIWNNQNNGEGAAQEQQAEDTAYEAPIANYINGWQEKNAEKFLSQFPTFISDKMKDIITDDFLKDSITSFEEQFGTNITMSYKVNNKEELSEEELRQTEQNVKSSFEQDITITKGYKLQTDLTIKGDKDEETDNATVEVYQIDGNWYRLALE